MGRRRKSVKGLVNSNIKTRIGKGKEKFSELPSYKKISTSATNMINDDADNDSQDFNNHIISPPIALNHKNFGKFRCLPLKNIPHSPIQSDELCASDLNVEVKVVDPCASSESENSNSLEALHSANKNVDQVMCKSFYKASRNEHRSSSGSPVILKSLPSLVSQDEKKSLQNSSDNITLSTYSFDTQLPDPTLNIIISSDPRRALSSTCNMSEILGALSNEIYNEEFCMDSYECEVIVGEDNREIENKLINEDEVCSIHKIVADNVENRDISKSETDYDVFTHSELVDTKDLEHNIFSSLSPIQCIDNKQNNEMSTITIFEQDFNEFERKLNNMIISSNDIHSISSIIHDNNLNNFKSDNNSELNKIKNQLKINKKNYDNINQSETCSTPTSLISEEDTQISHKLESDKNEIILNYSTDSSSSSSIGVRRSSRIKTINVQKQRSKGHGLVKNVNKNPSPLVKNSPIKKIDSIITKTQDISMQSITATQNTAVFSVPNSDSESKPVKVKSRWRRSSEMEMENRSPVTPPLCSPNTSVISKVSSLDNISNCSKTDVSNEIIYSPEIQCRLDQFQNILVNEYHCDRAISKEAKKMTCDCFLTKEEIERGEMGCGEDCLNRLLMIECNSRCPVGDRCTNRRFQSNQYCKLCVIKTEKKGLGIQTVNDIAGGEFLMEYVGEVLNWKQFNQRAKEYSSDKSTHHYFMSLKGDTFIDATLKGNISRFINHSCDPNAETQKWTVNGDLKIGFFSKRSIKAGDEITFDYQFQRFGKEALRCFCEASNCRGWIGEEPDSLEEDEEESEEDENDKSKDDKIKSNEIQIEEKLNTDKIEVNTEQEHMSPVKDIKKELKRRSKRTKPSTNRTFNELLQDMDIEQEMKNLSHTGIKNQSHTLSLCRAMVRAKNIKERISILKLLATADLPCRRLFLDYRGLRLLAPWCENTDAASRLELLLALERLPIPNRTILKETKIFSNVQNWLYEAENISNHIESSDDSRPGTPVLIDENTGLPIEKVIKFDSKTNISAEKTPKFSTTKINDETKKKKVHVLYTSIQREKITKLSKELINRWITLQEAFKIPKKERIELMKEHERQANEPQSKTEKDKENVPDKEKWEERYNRHDKKRPLLPSPDIPRKTLIRLDERILTPVPSMSKEERRREFAARAALNDQIRRTVRQTKSSYTGDKSTLRQIPSIISSHWVQPQDNNITNAFSSNTNINNVSSIDYSNNEYNQQEYMQVDYTSSEYRHQQHSYPVHYSGQSLQINPSVNTSNTSNSSYNYINYCSTNYPNSNYSSASTSNSPFINIPLPPNTQQNSLNSSNNNQLTPQPIPSLVTNHHSINSNLSSTIDNNTLINPQPIPTLVPPPNQTYKYDENYYQTSTENVFENQEISSNLTTISTDENQELNDVVRWTPVRLPSRWRSVKDVRGRTYYYHVKYRVPQWTPPLYSPTLNNDDDTTDEEEVKEEIKTEVETVSNLPSVTKKVIEGVNGIYQVFKEEKLSKKNGIVKGYANTKTVRKKRPTLVTERIISPRNEEDKIASKLELKRYKENKEKLRRRKEMILAATAEAASHSNKYKKTMKHKKDKEKNIEVSEKTAKKIKDIFTAQMAKVIVRHLDPYRREDCLVGRITNTADFKHLAKKLTHFVMLKELKHCQTVNELECNDSVKQKSKEFVKKYMAKFGPVYQRPPDEMDYSVT